MPENTIRLSCGCYVSLNKYHYVFGEGCEHRAKFEKEKKMYEDHMNERKEMYENEGSPDAKTNCFGCEGHLSINRLQKHNATHKHNSVIFHKVLSY